MLVIENLSHRGVSFLSPGTDRAAAPSGTGPFRWVRYEPRRLLEVSANPQYWGSKPLNERIVFRFVPDGQARLLALAKGEIDVVADVNPQVLLSLTPSMPVQLHASRPVSYVALLVNKNGKPPFHKLADRRLRQALALAIDRKTLASVLYAGRGAAADGLLPQWMFGLGKHTQEQVFDPSAANQLLDQAGWLRGPDGQRARGGEKLGLRLVAAFPGIQSVAPLPELLERMFRAVGVDLQIVAVEDDNLYTERYLAQGDGDLFMELAANTNLDPTFLLFHLFHSRTPWQGYRHMSAGPEVDAALDEARASSDPLQRIAAVRRAHAGVIDDAVAAIPILLVPQFVLSRPGMTVPMFEHRDWIDYGAVRLPTAK